ncbi:hypothetical protein F3L20_18115 [Streptomyces tendae]|uniref:Uncharacterized protein n=1 Tax=Streptomyces tendae TaxID=1932 RepID=A0ABX5ZS75_STRTE|nr:hypothetical protein F3L20_18115 [Streptomyces tendae]
MCARPGSAGTPRTARGRLRTGTGPGAGQRPEHGPHDQGGDHHDEPSGQQKHHQHDRPLRGCRSSAARTMPREHAVRSAF